MTSSNIVVKSKVRDLPDQWVFFIFVGAGALSILLLKALSLPQIIVTLVPILILLGYAALVATNRRFRLREDRIGDNCYYMGFVFTLISLAYALWAYEPDGSGVRTIISNFGIALGTGSRIGALLFVSLFSQTTAGAGTVRVVQSAAEILGFKAY